MDEHGHEHRHEHRAEVGREQASRAGLTPLTDDECLALLSRAEVGRIAWCTSRGPVVLPVNIRLVGHAVLIRASGLSAMVAKIDAERVAVQVDHLDADRREGWSVLARGRAEVSFGPPTPGSPEPWPPGERSAAVRVTVDELSGRRLTAGQ
ncbi:pyridoxamine 5'-phosphate oxidase family protein [Nocardioides sp. LMS-CY]|uniref:pyridoxamine 5'-phosphate oxidase family protein n=1 Tax=Nocardioides sp. (strain LMS-CY) TaxID=2840457 RepID=UPI001C000D33|nr:pyridoxamine 5'-phosphate oxidase family protein [Nocardioides sp. LMS-CY]QWF24277.1 pyridoxamine 5'-phosphate oxidase family protein [Nocardioides sp. LMS-CY]